MTAHPDTAYWRRQIELAEFELGQTRKFATAAALAAVEASHG
jgi:hypothetical protein